MILDLFRKEIEFENLQGYDDIKDIVKRALDVEDNYNLIFIGPPASAKTLFLLGIIEYKKGAYFDGSNTTNRILDVLEEKRPKIICIDELDKMPRQFQTGIESAGYCLPHNVQDDTTSYSTASTSTTASGTSTNLDHPASKSRSSLLIEKQQATETDMENFLTNETGLKVISAIPCYCDIQFSTKEFLTVLYQPEHHFAKQLEQLVHAVETI